MNVNDAFPSKYIKADDLKGQEVTVTIERVEMEIIGQGHDQSQKPVVYFQGAKKGLVLNKTNSMNIASVYGPETGGWVGRAVTLFSAWVDYQGKSVQAVRLRPTVQPINAHTAQAPVQPLPTIGGQPGFVGAGQAGSLPPAQPQHQPQQDGPPAGHPAAFNDRIGF